MKFHLQIEDKERFIKVPLTRNEISTLYELCFFPENDEIKENNFKIPLKKMMFVVHDVIDKGVVYELTNKKGKLKKFKKVHYSIRKPKWRIYKK